MSSEIPIKGFLFDIYNVESQIYIWILSDNGTLNLVSDTYYPVIYADGPVDLLKKLVKRLYELNALYKKPEWAVKKHFYRNEDIKALKITISRPSVLYKIRSKLFAFYGKIDIYHSDIDLIVSYLYEKNIYPLAEVIVETEIKDGFNRVKTICSLEPVEKYDYKIPPLRVMRMYLRQGHRLQISKENPLVIEGKNSSYTLSVENETRFLREMNKILIRENPDCILSSYGDQILFPFIFSLSQKHKIPLHFDRDTSAPVYRKIIKKGKSFNTYGSWIFRAPSYPLFGRWHIDSANSFTYKETQLLGVLELSRISRLPVQKLARSSTGSALTAIETAVAIEKNYLVPWQKSSLEEEKTWYELHTFDKGGLVFMPETSKSFAKENVCQLDFSQMYPSIMHIHNISPETVNCLCCRPENDKNKNEIKRVPEIGYHICQKRRGVVSDALRHILKRRAYYKKMNAISCGAEKSREKTRWKALADSLKWINVVSFGYLGFRNAKFGRLESHESVTAFGRDILLGAVEIAEENGYILLHAITDCIFIAKKDMSALSEEEIKNLSLKIYRAARIQIASDGIYCWLLFLPSRQDKNLPTPGKYLGRFQNKELKYRGIAARRKDMPLFIRKAQLALLDVMKEAESIEKLKKKHSQMHFVYLEHESRLKKREVFWQDLLLRKTVSRDFSSYLVDNATALSLKELHEQGVNVQPGEKVRYLVLDQKNKNKSKRYISEESILRKKDFERKIKYDIEFYQKLWFESYKEIWELFAPEGYFETLPKKQMILFHNADIP
ncbi:MAG: DNA polymerase [Spirochaetia bacterium]|nr:DNA polymerase [Spirochaetia bacterium]